MNFVGDEERQKLAGYVDQGQRGGLGRGSGRLAGHEEGSARRSR